MLLFKKPGFMQSGVERFRDQLEQALGQDCTLYRHPSPTRKLPKIFVLVFSHFPEKGCLTAFTYGLSTGSDQLAPVGRELVIQVKSENENWGHILGFLIGHLREDCPFDPGQVIRFGQPIASDSTMQHFLVHHPDQAIGPTSYRLSKKYSIELVQISPIHEREIELIDQQGWLPFLTHIESVKEQVDRPAISSLK